MHQTALMNARRFNEIYVKGRGGLAIVEIGSQDVNGSIRPAFGEQPGYVGLDFAPGDGVDVILEDPYVYPFESDSVDVVVTSSCFEHSEFFWLSFMEGVRVLRPGGLFFLNVPSNGPFHGYPVDCWRFYPNSGQALANWAVRNGQDVVMLESFTTPQAGGYMNDFNAVFLKDSSHIASFPERIVSRLQTFTNGYEYGRPEVLKHRQLTEDQAALKSIHEYLEKRLKPI